MSRKDIFRLVAGILFFIVVAGGFLCYCGLPQLSDFRNSVYGDTVALTFIFAVLLYIALSRKIGLPLLGKITVLGAGIVCLLSAVLNLGRGEALFYLAYSIVNISVAIYLYRKTGVEYKSVWIIGALSYLTTAAVALQAEYSNSVILSPTFLTVSLVGAALVFLLCLIYAIRDFRIYRKIDGEHHILIPLAGLLGGFLLTWLTVISMNVYLDRSAPVCHEFVIVDKSIQTGARQLTTYGLEVEGNGCTFKIAVLDEVYYSYEVNDPIVLSRYDGAFGEPYYIYDAIGKQP